MRKFIGVIGAGECPAEIADLAYRVGYGIAQQSGVLICGGLGGVMAAACRGAKDGGGLTIGILPGPDRGEANPWVDIPIPTGMSEARNAIIVRASDALIAIAGSYGTLSELGFAFQLGVPVVGLKTLEFDLPIVQAQTPNEAVSEAFRLARR